jgi:hypothetical protein
VRLLDFLKRFMTLIKKLLQFLSKPLFPKNPSTDVYWTIDKNGHGYLHYNKWEDVLKKFDSQIEGARQLSILAKQNGGHVILDDAGRLISPKPEQKP